jgi:hypothetical protein
MIAEERSRIELAFKGNPIMVRRKGTVRSVRHTILNLPLL